MKIKLNITCEQNILIVIFKKFTGPKFIVELTPINVLEYNNSLESI